MTKVKDICNLNVNTIDKKTNYSIYKYLDTGNITDNYLDDIKIYKEYSKLPSRARRIVSQDDIIISTVRPKLKHYGYIEGDRKNLIVSTGFTVINPDKNLVNSKYLYYFLTSIKITRYLQMIAETAVSSYPSIKPNVIGNININFPSITEQKLIIQNVYNIDKKIQNSQKMISQLKELIKLELFNMYKNPKYEFTEEVISDFVNYKKNPIIPIKTEKYKYYSIPEFDKSLTYEVASGNEIKSSKYSVEYGDILVSKLNPRINRVIIPVDSKNCIASTEFVVWDVKNKEFLNFFYATAISDYFIKYCSIASMGTSNSHKRVTPTFMLKYPFKFSETMIMDFDESVKIYIEKLNLLTRDIKDLIIAKELLLYDEFK